MRGDFDIIDNLSKMLFPKDLKQGDNKVISALDKDEAVDEMKDHRINQDVFPITE